MNSQLQLRLLDAARVCLRPLARILMRAGISYRQFEEVAKIAFVEEGLGEPDEKGRLTNVSRVSVRTGLSRKEVARVRDALLGFETRRNTKLAQAFDSSHAARVLQLWHSDRRFADHGGRPLDLEFDDGTRSFSALVKVAGGDVPPGAVRAELLAAGSIRQLDDQKLRVLKRYFIPSDIGEEIIVGFRHFVRPVLEGLAHNSSSSIEKAYIQRLAYSDRIRPVDIEVFRKIARERSEELLQSLDEWIGDNEAADRGVDETGKVVGLGVFYYEGAPLAEGK